MLPPTSPGDPASSTSKSSQSRNTGKQGVFFLATFNKLHVLSWWQRVAWNQRETGLEGI